MPAPQQQQSGSDNSYAIIWLLTLLFLTAGIVWYFQHAAIVAAIFKIKLIEAQIINYFTNQLADIATFLQTTSTANVGFHTVAEVSYKIGWYARFPIIVILLIIAVILYFRDVTLRFRKTYNMTTLLKQEAENWPLITPIVNLNLVSEDINKGPWAMGEDPITFSKKRKLLIIPPVEQKRRSLEKEQPDIKIKQGEAKRHFIMQLGDLWEGPDKLPIHRQALLATFAAKLNRDRDGCRQLLDQMNRSSAAGKLDFSGARSLLRKHINSKESVRVMEKHAYTMTVMAAMLAAARSDGVFPPSEFLWLKPMDRRLWYMLNSIGRQTPFPEVGGPFAHMLAEKKIGRRCIVPRVDEAVKALESAVKEKKFTDKELEECREA